MTRKIGCTGGIACGKSEAASRILAHGIPLLDTDHVAHEVLSPGNEVFNQVVEAFGDGIVQTDGSLNRKVLGNIVFNDPEALQHLNRLVHPEVGRRWRAWLADRDEPVAVVVIPLMIETGSQNEFDDIVCVSASTDAMRERLRSRGLNVEQAEQRIQSQLPLEIKEKHATWVLTNNGTLTEFRHHVDHWISTCLLTEKNQHV